MDKIMDMSFQQAPAKPIEPWKNSIYLQPNVYPICYELLIRPFLDYGRFSGREKITVEVTGKTTYFAVHAKGLNIKASNVTFVGQENVSFPVKNSFYYEPHDFFILDLEKPAKPGMYYLDFDFDANLESSIQGFFRRDYFSQRMRVHRPMAATKFKLTEARRAYPCFDEPHLKATFKMKIVKPVENYVAITNEVVEKEEFGPDKNEITVFFKETKPISTFATGFIVADLKDSQAVIVDNMGELLIIKFHAAAEKIDRVIFAKDLTSQLTKFFINYFEMPFPVSKLDFVALPEISDATIEQFGYATCNENFLMYDERINSVERMKSIALTVAREICRQWFGCLVTMKSWNDLWLSEGFVSLMKYRALNEGVSTCGDWNLAEQLILDAIQPAMDTDAAVVCRPLQVDFENSDQFSNETFDEVTSRKGLAVLRMLERFIGKEGFRKGIHKFLSTYSYSSVTISNFWDCLNSEVTDPDISISSVMERWTKQSGYPVIYVIKRANTWILSQSRFVTDRNSFVNLNDSPFRYKWDVPIYYIASNDKTPVLVWFRSSEECLKIVISDRMVSYLKFNYGQTGFYRVNYEGCLWKLFAQLLLHDRLTFGSVDRAGLLDDVFHLAEAGQTDYQYAFELIRYLEKEQDFLPWMTVSRNLKKLLARFPNSPYYGLLTRYMRSIINKMYGYELGQFNWNLGPSDSFVTRLFRREILELACISQLPECMNDLGVKFKKWVATGESPVHPDLINALFRHGMHEVGTITDWEVVWSRYKRESNTNMKQSLLACLANTREQCAIMSILSCAGYEIPDSDYMLFLRYLSENLYSGNIHWNFIRNDFDYVVGKLSSQKSELYDFIAEFTSKYYMNYQLKEVQTFYDEHPEAGANNAKEIVVTNINRNLAFVERNKEVICGWLSENIE